jgi:organic hydroperoxide reductase OsmC/OhrA
MRVICWGVRPLSSGEFSFTIQLERMDNYEFKVRFDSPNLPEIIVDEPEPVGKGTGPNASRLLAAAVGNCLSASFLFCLSKARIPVTDLKTSVEALTRRNENGRWRIAGLKVKLNPTFREEDASKAKRCLELFEDFCIVTQSVRNGINVAVDVTLD